MPPKKKKTQMKKVERGFATTSIPKKVVAQAQPEPVTEPEPNVEIADEHIESKIPGDNVTHLDEQELKMQGLVDRCQEKIEKEILRTMKTIEYDRRISTSLPLFQLEEKIQYEILQLLEKTEPNTDPWSQMKDSDKSLEQLGILYGALRRLGFREPSVVESIGLSSQMDFAEFLDWLYIRCPPEDLDFDKSQRVLMERMSIPGVSLLSPAVQAITGPSPRLGENRDQNSRSQVNNEAMLAVRLDLTDVDEDPNVAYVQLKLKLSELTNVAVTKRRIPPNDPMAAALRSQIDTVKNDYLFREKIAEADFQAKWKERLSSFTLAQLRGDQVPASSSMREPQSQPLAASSESTHPLDRVEPPSKSNSVFDNDSDNDSEGGMLQLLESIPSEVTSATGSVITVRNLPIPRTWSNRTPKKLLQEVSTSLDRYAVIAYKDMSGGGRLKRATVTIRWTGGFQSKWEMLDIACHDLPQAEFYAATVAAHALTYAASTDGFQVANLNVNSKMQTTYKALPPAFRDVWEELESKRKSEEDRGNREVWSKLSDILRVKSTSSETEARRPLKRTDESAAPLARSRGPMIASFEIMTEYQKMEASTGYQDMLLQRNTLPIAAYRQAIVETIDMARVVVLSGETGCGKSTQLPSFILENQLCQGRHCKIVVTEPRRISAISLAQRVSQELGEAPGALGTSSSLVGYSIRLESHTSKRTRLTFVTNGIALRMLESGSGKDGQGTAFDDITHIVVDEVHERNIDSDFLLIVLKSLLVHRRDLKVILMSATLDAEKISNFFGGCPVISVPGRTFPVDVRYLEDAIEYTRYAITPSSPYARRDLEKSKRSDLAPDWNEDLIQDDDDVQPETENDIGPSVMIQYSTQTRQTFNLLDEYLILYELIIRLLEVVCFEDPSYFELSHAFLIFMPGLAEIRRLNDMLSEHPQFGSDDFIIYPLHSTIPSEGQGIVFEVPPAGIRKIVIATNIAETGVTIPDITCVIDTGKHREMRYDEKRQISRLIETFIAKSNAVQRRGRAGRVRSGLCFHLFSGARHAMMAEHPLPEMLRLSLSDLALRIKIMKVNLGTSISDVLSRALDPPSAVNIQRAVAALVDVKALSATEEITHMGRLLSKLPTDVHLGKFLLLAALFKCLDPALTIAATLNSKSPFVTPFGLEKEADKAKARFASGSSDFLTIHNAFSSFRRASANPGFIRKFCKENFLSHQNLQQIEELRQQFLGYLIDTSFIKVDATFTQEFSRARYSRQRNTRFVIIPEEYDENSSLENNNMALFNAALVAGLFPKLLAVDSSLNGRSMKTLTNNQAAFFHPSSVNFGRRPGDLGAGYLMYFTIMQSKRLYAWETAPVDDLAIILLCGEAEFKLVSNTIEIDRKIKYRVAPKTNVALKHLRKHLLDNLALQFRGKPLSETQKAWSELAMKALGVVKSPEN